MKIDEKCSFLSWVPLLIQCFSIDAPDCLSGVHEKSVLSKFIWVFNVMQVKFMMFCLVVPLLIVLCMIFNLKK